MTPEKAREKAQEKANETGLTVYVCSIDHEEDRTYIIADEAYLNTGEFEAFDGRVEKEVLPESEEE